MKSSNIASWLIILIHIFSASYAFGQKQEKKADIITAIKESNAAIVVSDSLLISDALSTIKIEFFDRGAIYEANGDIEEATRLFSSYVSAFSKYIYPYLIMISREEVSEIWSENNKYIKYIQNFAIINSPNYEPLGGIAYDCELLSKGLLLNTSRTIRNAVFKSGDPDLIHRFTKLEELKAAYSSYKTHFEILINYESELDVWEVIGPERSQGLADEIRLFEQMSAEFKTVLREEERYIGYQIVGDYSNLVNLKPSTWTDIWHKLGRKHASIEFVAHSAYGDNPENISYAALLIHPSLRSVKVIPLTDTQTLLKALNANDYDTLYKLIWFPLEEYLEDIVQVFISTSGLFCIVPFAGFKVGHRYVTDNYMFHNLMSTRDILHMDTTLRNKRFRHPKALLFGGADFSYSPEGLLQTDSSIVNHDIQNLNRGQINEFNPTRGQGFDYLPGSKREVMAASKIFKNSFWSVESYTDEFATEGRLKHTISDNLVSILHISTHGFYFTPSQKSTSSELDSGLSAAFKFSNDPLMRSGLLFAGANHIWSGKPPLKNLDDGILTALEISYLKLSNIELVVLSACKSNLGDIDYTEGLYGIQRAFRIAGAGVMLLTLFDIPDRETVEFMETFYKVLVGLGPNWINYAFQAALNHMRAHYPNNPEKWAGFVLIE